MAKWQCPFSVGVFPHVWYIYLWLIYKIQNFDQSLFKTLFIIFPIPREWMPYLWSVSTRYQYTSLFPDDFSARLVMGTFILPHSNFYIKKSITSRRSKFLNLTSKKFTEQIQNNVKIIGYEIGFILRAKNFCPCKSVCLSVVLNTDWLWFKYSHVRISI